MIGHRRLQKPRLEQFDVDGSHGSCAQLTKGCLRNMTVLEHVHQLLYHEGNAGLAAESAEDQFDQWWEHGKDSLFQDCVGEN